MNEKWNFGPMLQLVISSSDFIKKFHFRKFAKPHWCNFNEDHLVNPFRMNLRDKMENPER